MGDDFIQTIRIVDAGWRHAPYRIRPGQVCLKAHDNVDVQLFDNITKSRDIDSLWLGNFL